jgi:FtsP/CotA-like multicopper oxidase with cupredoxin domain
MTLSGSRICQIPDSGLINGVGRYEGGPSVARPRINVVAGKKYRFRVINISAYSGFTFSVEKHSLTIIEVGTSILKNDLDINTFPG